MDESDGRSDGLARLESRTRRHAIDTVADVDPGGLRSAIEEQLSGSMVPGTLVRLSACATDSTGAPTAAADRATGVQLIYDGLRVTRGLVHDQPWGRDGEALTPEADIDVLVADVLVARGFYLLARTEAADRAVGVVRAFGRDQTRRRSASDAERLDRNLEVSVFELATAAGTTAAGATASRSLLDCVGTLARSIDTDPIPPAAAVLDGFEAEMEQAIDPGGPMTASGAGPPSTASDSSGS
jgi:hypothetical protein